VTVDARIAADGQDVEALCNLASQALGSGEEEAAIPVIRTAAEKLSRPILWHWLGLLQRSLDEHEEALASLERAARLKPEGPKIAQALAQTAMEAGLPAVELFETALALAPQDGSVIVGLAAARNAAGDGERGAADVDLRLRATRTVRGDPGEAAGSDRFAGAGAEPLSKRSAAVGEPPQCSIEARGL
jgi:tetratricopeptide (TPR) repeat protein